MIASPILLAVERRLHRDAELRDRALHVLGEARARARRQLERAGTLGRPEVVHVAPVARHGRGVGALLEQLAQQRPLADAGWPEREQVVAMPPDPDAEAERTDRTLLTDDSFDEARVVGGRERNVLRAARPLELGGREPRGWAHPTFFPRRVRGGKPPAERRRRREFVDFARAVLQPRAVFVLCFRGILV